MTGRVHGYVRVSTSEQGESGAGLAAQRTAIEAAATSRGWDRITWHQDVASGRSLDRPAIAALLPTLRRGDVLAVSRLDRLSRSLVDAVGLLEQSQRRGWVLVALDLGVDTSTPSGRLVASVLASVGAWEREVIGARTREALAAKKQAGTRLGRRSDLPADVLDRIEAERAAGRTLAAIAAGLDADRVPTAWGGPRWWPSSVASALRARANDRLAGLAS